MSNLTDSVSVTVSVITAMGALGTAAFGLVDAFKAFGGGVSNIGFGDVTKSLEPFESALNGASATWRQTLRANWINGVAKEDQKTAAKTLIRLGLSSTNVPQLAGSGHVDTGELAAVLAALENGATLTTQAAQVFGRFNAVIDASMDAGFERGDQRYRNYSKICAAMVALFLALCAGYLLHDTPVAGFVKSQLNADRHFLFSKMFWWSLLIGLLSVPVAPVAKDLASSIQAAAAAVTSAKS